jgi:putative ABC transport system permease protein
MRTLVRFLLWLFPRRFRRTFENDMLAAFDDRWREHHGWGTAARTVADLTSSALLAHCWLETPRKGDGVMKTLWYDIRFSTRILRKNPGFAAVVILTLALGIGANTAIFSIVDAILLRPLPFHDPGQLMSVIDIAPGAGLRDIGMSPPEYEDLAQRSNVFAQIAAVTQIGGNLTGGGQPERVELMNASPNYFALLGAQPQIGRVFDHNDENKSFSEAAILSDGLWKRRFGGDPNVLGRKIWIDNDLYIVVGVMPPGFRHPGRIHPGRAGMIGADIDLWVASDFVGWPFARRSLNILDAIARLKPGMTAGEARRRLDNFWTVLRKQYPNDYPEESKRSTDLESLQEAVVGKTRPLLVVLLSTVAIMLLIACVNIANLLLARASGRHREIAVRQAMGASRGRLVRQLLTESMLLSLAGGLVGILSASVALDLLLRIVPARIPRLLEVQINPDVLLFALFISLLTGVLFGLVPALETSAWSPSVSLQDGGRAGGGIRQKRAGQLLMVSEFAGCVMLMIGAGLLVRSFWRLTHIDPGFDPRNVLVARVKLPQPNDPKLEPYIRPEDRTVFYRELLRRTRRIPGVSATAITNSVPTSTDLNQSPVTFEGQAVRAGESTLADVVSVSPDYFAVMGARILQGRVFRESDQFGSPDVGVLDQSTALRFWPEASAVGKRLKFGRSQSNARWVSIIGVIGDIRHDGMDVDGVPHVYYPVYQRPVRAFAVVLRSPRNPAFLAESLRRTLQGIDPQVAVFGVRTMEDMLDASLAQHRFSAQMMVAFAALALGLASIGIYGVLAYSMGQRTREIGIRIALGANAAEVSRMVLRQGMQMIVVGVAVGTGLALGLSQLLSRLIFGVSPRDPLVFLATPVILAAVALLAGYVPARRAARVDPVIALRLD